MNETMSEAQVDLVKALFEQAVLDEQSAWTFKEIKEVFADLTTGHLNDMRTKGFIKNSGGNINKWWITPKAVNFLGLESNNGQANNDIENNDLIDVNDTNVVDSQAIEPVVVENVQAFNASAEITHCKTAQMAAALRQANEVITKLAAENAVLRDSLNKEAICEFNGYLLGDSAGVSGLQLYSEDDRLVAFGTIDEAKANGFQSCLESAYDFEVYGLVKVGGFRSRTVVDWVGA
jgi:hypothetical protein